MLHIPHAFQMHRANFHNMPNLFTLQNAVAATTGHSGDIQELRAVDHVIIYSRS